jgi:hypothetical protein
VPSCGPRPGQRERREEREESTYVLDLLHGKVRVGRDALMLGSDVDDDHDGASNVALEQVVDFMVRRAELWSRVIPSDHAFARW